uniref:NADH dehydrogenase subunit 6 n=1 Tax=Cemus sauteri TaxID=871497 RepID=A0A7S4YYX2_9HEMI|nr:NADH dehydrogenase subunit 6 [Cemus sauteri]
MKLIQVIITMNSLMSMNLNHPISLGSILMFQSICTAIQTMLLSKNSWYSIILFITFSSGIMIMFMYMSSISSNEKFSMSLKVSLMVMIMMLIMAFMYKDKIPTILNNLMEEDILIQENEEKKSIFKMISSKKLYLTTFMTLMILLILITISNLINSFEGPLKLTYVNF